MLKISPPIRYLTASLFSIWGFFTYFKGDRDGGFILITISIITYLTTFFFQLIIKKSIFQGKNNHRTK
jgi:hypothetical protein